MAGVVPLIIIMLRDMSPSSSVRDQRPAGQHHHVAGGGGNIRVDKIKFTETGYICTSRYNLTGSNNTLNFN